ncbi:MAG: tannase/feruloyl esterase family alpha/beta hydrolase [Alphaproteobacteria bacterium]|nr:tannase/feruloyl esterase family alpha/beta hydrolase [Alphaproteobacteria bacterium]
MAFALARAAVLAGLFLASAPALAGACDRAASLRIADVHVVRASEVGPERPYTAPFPHAAPITRRFCRIEGVIEKEIGFELWLPLGPEWNGRLLVGGVGGQAGQLDYRELDRGIRRGYAAGSTDTGHRAEDRHWLLGRPDRAANYAWRANHLLAVRAKATIAAFYDRAPRNAFFVGCSGGGRQALTEVQRFPDDYDGVVAGAPGVNTPEMSARRMWEMQQHSRLAGLMKPVDWKLVSDSALKACDSLDGIVDGVIDDPRRCGFDPGHLLCAGASRTGCLSAGQIVAVRRLYAPLHDEDGRPIDDGLLPGIPVSPVTLPEPFTPGPPYLAVSLFGDGVHGDASWDSRSFSLARDLPAIDKVMNLHADNPDIGAFLRRGGRLILYQGWADPLVAPQTTLAYYEAVRRRNGRLGERGVRLFMAPGVDHCRGGAGPDLFGGAGGDAPLPDADHDLLTALERWVDQRRAPERIVATRIEDGTTRRTRPLCAWPARARYSGHGSTDDATNFICAKGVT